VPVTMCIDLMQEITKEGLWKHQPAPEGKMLFLHHRPDRSQVALISRLHGIADREDNKRVRIRSQQILRERIHMTVHRNRAMSQ
jgi:hypothetical protein